MSTGLTPNYSFQYPISTDPVNVAGDMQDLAEGLDTFLTNPSFINSVDIDGGSLTTTALTASIFNANSTTLNIGGAATTINIGSGSGQVNFAGHVNIATGKQYEINNVSVLTSTTLGSSVVNSSLQTVGTISTGTWNATTIAVNKGGTGLTSYTIGDLVYASGSTTLAKLAGVATGNALISGGVGAAPSWGKIGLTTHVSGTLPVANGGTGVTTSTGTGNVVLSASPTLSGTPLAPTAGVDTNTTQIATTAYVVGQGYLKSATASSTYAPIASPTFTGTVTVPGLTSTGNLMPSTDNTGVVGDATYTWNNGQFTNMTIDSTLNVRAAIDLADSDVLRWGSSDDVTSAYNGTTNKLLFNIVTASAGIDFSYQGSNVLELSSTGVNIVGTFTVNGSPVSGGGGADLPSVLMFAGM